MVGIFRQFIQEEHAIVGRRHLAHPRRPQKEVMTASGYDRRGTIVPILA
jgi:hypothetical protein